MTDLRWSAVLFDFDGTLANTIPLIIGSFRWTLAEYDLPPADDATIRSWIGRTLPDVFTELAGTDEVDELMAGYRAWQLENHHLLQTYPGMDALLARLADAGVPLGIATSRRRDSAEHLMRVAGLDGSLPLLVGLEDTSAHKPDAAPLLLAAERIGADPSGAVYVGDAVVDLRAAQAAGMTGVGVTWGAGLPGDLRAETSLAVVDTVTELTMALAG
ncbi:MAG: HAD family hydrolase [Propioniciclava sp.]|uniref:HAD family hydrolase n=1 Tax=Propioniciclava sp. TaxID=2038686 RepID=UPI0039E62D52